MSVVTLQCVVDGTEVIPSAPIFKTFFLGLSALGDGFSEGCSPFLGFDGDHLKGLFWGVLLAAIGLDGNNGLFPVAFVVVESECKESWSFFFENLSRMVGGFSIDKPWTFMSERQKGLVETINEIVPHAINRRCARHIYANFRSQFAGAALKRYFWQAARSYNAAVIKRMPGRPKKSRRKEPGEAPNAVKRSSIVRCRACNELGHNRRTCPSIQVRNSGKDSDLHVPLSQLTKK
ncbi:UNVERIFIED_CONTAM: hypothetical protein Sradi_5737900 [Sesamum radiatum]|uniref:MULE transposase domain-containing protein n=1 Tax=Sesamum radiatum TaxID=300843 RepID=A0AAW2L567_SESRA